MNIGLSSLIHPLKISDFFAHYEANRPFVIHHSPDELRVLRDLPFLNSLETLLKSWPAPIQAHLPDARDEVSSVDITAKDAQKLFNNGMGLLFNDANQYVPVLQDWVDQIRADLGLSSLTYGRSLIYATPDGKGTAPHFDQNINFVLQIHGTKKWTMAKNETVQNPTVRHTMGQFIDPEMMSYLESPMPETMPAETFTFDLTPGTLLFVPKGVWHSTEAEGHALSLNFTFTAPSWAELFLSALRSRLNLSPEWRETADGVGDHERRFDAEKKFDHLLASLAYELTHWRADDVFTATES
jgi:50S ribosomal protein L16 3-hydroxylase